MEIAENKEKKLEKMETHLMAMDETRIVLLLNILMSEQEVLKQAKIYALNVNKVSIKTIQPILNSESQDDLMDIE